MSEVIIVDTDVVSFLLKNDTRAQAYRPHLQDKLLAFSFMTVAELYRWAYVRNWGKSRLCLVGRATANIRDCAFRSRTLQVLGRHLHHPSASRQAYLSARRLGCGNRTALWLTIGNS